MFLRRLVLWLILFEVLRAGRDHWDRLDPSDRARGVRRSCAAPHGNPRNLTAADRDEPCATSGRRMRLGRLGFSLATAVAVGRRKRRRQATLASSRCRAQPALSARSSGPPCSTPSTVARERLGELTPGRSART